MRKLLCLLVALAVSTASAEEIRFLAYNLQNYFTSKSGDNSSANTPKPDRAIAALVGIIASEKPDIIGVCEMGSLDDFHNLLTRLKNAGVDLPHIEYVQALDPDRHVALASRFPISSRNSQAHLSFDLGGQKQYFKRGILDVTVDVAPGYSLHFVGTHLKSRRDVPEDQSLVRRSEAHLLRLHAKAILQENPAARLIVYGDLNDTPNEAPIREIIGQKRTPDYLKPVDLRDANGEKWTHYWKIADSYSRIDYVLVSPAATKNVRATESHIASPPNWNEASDHRPLVVVFKVPPSAQ